MSSDAIENGTNLVAEKVPEVNHVTLNLRERTARLYTDRCSCCFSVSDFADYSLWFLDAAAAACPTAGLAFDSREWRPLVFNPMSGSNIQARLA